MRALTEQYLLKVLPANRRVDLSVVAELSDVNIYKSLDEKKNSKQRRPSPTTLIKCLKPAICFRHSQQKDACSVSF